MKVYCKNCRNYFNPHDYGMRMLHKVVFGTPDMCNCYGSPRNKNHNCPKYKRSWWKFWIKEK